MKLLGGASHGRYYELKKVANRAVLTQDELTQVSLLIGIFKSLNILFSKKLADQWFYSQQPSYVSKFAAF
jgi:hypothetical protein